MLFQPRTQLIFELPKEPRITVGGVPMPNWMEVHVISCEPPILTVSEDESGAILTILIDKQQRLTLEVPLNGRIEAITLRRLSMRKFEELLGIWTIHRTDGSSEIIRSKHTKKKVEMKKLVCATCNLSTEQPEAMAEHMVITGHGLFPGVRDPREGIEFAGVGRTSDHSESR